MLRACDRECLPAGPLAVLLWIFLIISATNGKPETNSKMEVLPTALGRLYIAVSYGREHVGQPVTVAADKSSANLLVLLSAV